MRAINTYRHLSTFTVVHDMNVLIFSASASGIVGVAETTRLIDLAIASECFIVISANFSSWIDLFVAYLDANAFGSVIVDSLKRRNNIVPKKKKKNIIFQYPHQKLKKNFNKTKYNFFNLLNV